MLDSLRLVPRLYLAGHSYTVYQLVLWYIALDSPTPEQTAFIAACTASSAAVIKFYQASGKPGTTYYKS